MSSTAGARNLFATRPGSRMLIDAAVAAVALAGTLAQFTHGGIASPHPQSVELDRRRAGSWTCPRSHS